MKNLKRISRVYLKNITGNGGDVDEACCEGSDGGGSGCKQCVSCPNRQGSQSCYTDPNGNCQKASSMAAALC